MYTLPFYTITMSDTYNRTWEEMPPQLRYDTQTNLQTLMDWTTCVHVIKNNAVGLMGIFIISYDISSAENMYFRHRIAHKHMSIVERKYMASICQYRQRKNCMETCTG